MLFTILTKKIIIRKIKEVENNIKHYKQYATNFISSYRVYSLMHVSWGWAPSRHKTANSNMSRPRKLRSD